MKLLESITVMKIGIDNRLIIRNYMKKKDYDQNLHIYSFIVVFVVYDFILHAL